MNKKIYFAGSIRGGRQDASLYKRIIGYIQKTDTVLTEHVGDLLLSKHEGSTPKGFSKGNNEVVIYLQDTGWLQESDMVIAECTTPSLGVGYELAYAEKLGKPVHIFYDRNRTSLSAMLAGNAYFHIHPYDKEDEVYPVLKELLNQ